MENINLHKYFLNNNGKIIDKWTHYFDVYERHFSKYVNKNPIILEIGVNKGGSVNMWADYFGKGSKIIGIDIDINCKKHEDLEKNIFIEIADQSDHGALEAIIAKHGNPDIVIDDGSHWSKDMRASFECLFPKLKENGLYLIEDLHANYWWEYFDNGQKNPNTFIEYSKNKIDEVNALISNGIIPTTDFAKSIYSIHYYDSIVIYEKRYQIGRVHLQTGEDS